MVHLVRRWAQLHETVRMKNDDITKSGVPFLFRYRPNNEYTLDEIDKAYVYFSARNSLNDPFDSDPGLINFNIKETDIQKYYDLTLNQCKSEEQKRLFRKHFTPERLMKESHQIIPKFIESHGIACFSMLPAVNMALLANYTNNHKGICLQFNHNLDKKFFENLRYVKYVEELSPIEINPLIDQSKIYEIFYLKQKNWEYEKELRLIKEQKGPINFNRNSLRNIICGYNSEENYIEKIVQICEKKYENVDVYKMDKPNKQNNLSLTKMN